MKSETQRVILTIALCGAIYVIFSNYLMPAPAPVPPAPTPATARAADGGTAAPEKPGTAAAPSAAPGAPALPRVAEDKAVLETATMRVELSSHEGGLASLTLKNRQYDDRPRGKHAVALDLVSTRAKKNRPLRTSFPGNSVGIPAELEMKSVRATDREVVWAWENDRVRLEKKVSALPEQYALGLEIVVRNKSDAAVTLPLRTSMYGLATGDSSSGGFMQPPPNVRAVMCHAKGKLEEAPPDKLAEGPFQLAEELHWAGLGDKYFLEALIPVGAGRPRCEGALDKESGVLEAALAESISVGAGATETRRFVVFTGPKIVSALDALRPDGHDPLLGDAVNYGWLSPISRALLQMLLFFERLIGNWGIAIILLTVLVKLVTLPFTQKSMRSMKAMARLKPELERLKKQFGDDKARLNQEMMALYKQKGINPLGGCLPMLIQMPVWFALYSTLGNAVELYHSRFLWLADLTQPDPFFVIPVVMGAFMFIQQKTAPQPADSEQQKMLLYIMPVMFTFMSLWFPAGLTVYILTNTLLTMAHQFWNNRNEPKVPRAAKAKAST